MPRPKKFSDEEILEKMLDLEKKSPDGTVSLSELVRALIKEEHGEEKSIRKQSLSQRLDDKKRGKGLVQRGLVARVGRRFKLTDAGRRVVEAYRKIKEEEISGYIKEIAKTIFYDFYFSSIVNILEAKSEEKLPICRSLPADLLLLFLVQLKLIPPKVVVNKREFERELKRMWEKQIKYVEEKMTLKDAVREAMEILTYECGEHIGEIFDAFDAYLYALLGMKFYILGLEKVSLLSLKVHEGGK
jgi:hypothetical protein